MIRDDTSGASITFAIDIAAKTMYITSVHVPPARRGHGHAHMLIGQCARLARKYAVTVLKLDDMSTQYRETRNLYLRCGFVYDDCSGPEMTGRTSVVERSCRALGRATR